VYLTVLIQVDQRLSNSTIVVPDFGEYESLHLANSHRYSSPSTVQIFLVPNFSIFSASIARVHRDLSKKRTFF